jgi:hypothetical protein
LTGIEDLVIPRVLRLSGADLRRGGREKLLTDAGIALPLLLRSAGMYGGESVQRSMTEDERAQACADLHDDEAFHTTAYHDYASSDGFYRKYRAIFVDCAAFPYHLAISSDWLVHYFSADMEAHPWKLAEEQAYLDDPRQVLGRVPLRCSQPSPGRWTSITAASISHCCRVSACCCLRRMPRCWCIRRPRIA